MSNHCKIFHLFNYYYKGFKNSLIQTILWEVIGDLSIKLKKENERGCEFSSPINTWKL